MGCPYNDYILPKPQLLKRDTFAPTLSMSLGIVRLYNYRNKILSIMSIFDSRDHADLHLQKNDKSTTHLEKTLNFSDTDYFKFRYTKFYFLLC